MAQMFDMSLIQRGARLRRSPYFDATRRYGCKSYTVYNHTFLPSFYDDPVEEYWHLLNHVTVWDVGVERQVEIAGRDGFAFANLLVPRDLSQCPVGQARYVVLTDETGGILNDPVLLRLGENRFWLSLADSDVLLWAKGVATHSGLDVELREPDVWPLQVQGPKAKHVVQALFGDRVLEMPYYGFFEATLDGIPIVVTRTGWTGEIGYELYLCDGSRGDELWERVMAAGKPFKIRPTGPSDIRRIEAGMLNYGIDMTQANSPYEVGLGWLVDLDKASDFIGKSTLQRIHAQGVRRKLVGVEIDGSPIEFNEVPWPVLREGSLVGRVTSAIHSPRLQKNIGFAMVPVEHSKLGTDLQVDTPWGERSARVARRPFIDPEKGIPKS